MKIGLKKKKKPNYFCTYYVSCVQFSLRCNFPSFISLDKMQGFNVVPPLSNVKRKKKNEIFLRMLRKNLNGLVKWGKCFPSLRFMTCYLSTYIHTHTLVERESLFRLGRKYGFFGGG